MITRDEIDKLIEESEGKEWRSYREFREFINGNYKNKEFKNNRMDITRKKEEMVQRWNQRNTCEG